MNMADLQASIEEQKKAVARMKLEKSKRTPEQILLAEQKAEENKKIAERKKAHAAVGAAINKAVEDGHANPTDIAQLAAVALHDRGLEMPKTGTFDAATATVTDCRAMAKEMFMAGNFVAMKELHTLLGRMLKTVENASPATDAS
jgi:hypothetical protein